MCGCSGNVTRGGQVVTSNQLAAQLAAADAQLAAALSAQSDRDSLVAALVNSGDGGASTQRS
jgi:hypothetical protein